MKEKSIKVRLFMTNFIIILLSFIFIEVAMAANLKNSYYFDMENLLKNNIDIVKNIHNRYSFERQSEINELTKMFSYDKEMHFEVLDMEGNVLTSYNRPLEITDDDIIKSKKEVMDEFTTNIVKEKKSGTTYMSISKIIYKRGVPYRLLRCSKSLETLNLKLFKVISLYILFGIITILVGAIVSFKISKTITKPLKAAEEGAKKIAKGNFNVRIPKYYQDEVGSMVDTLNYMTEEIKNNEKLKNEFISSVSHELRTPLTSIKGWAMTLNLKEFTDEAKRRQGINIIINESDRLTSLVEQLLDFSKYQAGRMKIEKQEVNIKIIVENILQQLNPKIKSKGIKAKSYIEDDLIVLADKNKVIQVFINIIDNAIKFTEENEGTIYIYPTIDFYKISITIEDNGCGINEENLQKVKRKFFKLDTKKSGSGIGLAICDEIMKAHNGSINLESKEGFGTKVTLEFPL
ncbi:Signal transduction histidine kinase [Clostridium collagenovorans DSM 3089]|uniref:histidine kinase n=1 Tax=Clostridium collagenovorans DSM 3089 TaxID=1121306 RepID=A0A1M5W7V2_9CLOT|nr:HAMP domain-containing sensor histidine kinase [Clostridium collagenovorans]SHH83557.1 Signal transduction histidine kinase [Clostridium collagenovorans DSM 3089]